MVKGDIDRWLSGGGEEFLRGIGLRRGRWVLDFGCGEGYFSIPAAKVVGKEGRVYAVDRDPNSLKRLAKVALELSIRIGTNLFIVESSSLKNFGDSSFDFVLLYDVLHPHYFTKAERREILKEAKRVKKPEALISIYPKHMSAGEIREDSRVVGLKLEEQLFRELVHDGERDEGYVMNLR